MRRIAALVLAILFSISVVLPLVDSSAHRTGRPHVHRRHRKVHRSRAWWRRYRARQKRRRAAALARRRALLAAQLRHRDDARVPAADIERPVRISGAQVADRRANDARGAVSPLLQPERKSTTPLMVNGQTHFRLYAETGQSVGQAQLSSVNIAPSNVALMNARAQRRQLAGVPHAELRRQVIEKMIAGNGWVINDIEREVNGRRVFIVVAQTAASSDGRTPAQTWNFYFTEIDGRIYSLASHAPLEATEQMAAESEKVIATLPTSNRSVLANR